MSGQNLLYFKQNESLKSNEKAGILSFFLVGLAVLYAANLYNEAVTH